MLFDVQAALAEILGDAPAAHPAPVSRAAPRVEAPPAKVLPFAPPPEPSWQDGETFRHGRSVTGDPKTWTGRIVSLEEWRKLSDWDRHGPDGRLFCGICRAWVQSFPACHDGKGGDA